MELNTFGRSANAPFPTPRESPVQWISNQQCYECFGNYRSPHDVCAVYRHRSASRGNLRRIDFHPETARAGMVDLHRERLFSGRRGGDVSGARRTARPRGGCANRRGDPGAFCPARRGYRRTRTLPPGDGLMATTIPAKSASTPQSCAGLF
jgi:hypothetical protein